jgi:ribosomal protein S18 acetylase RimI-like enzyme
MELTDALIEDILFCMEDQNGAFMLDREEGALVNAEAAFGAEGDRYIPIPAWGSADGFHLMERFASGCRNELARTALHASLNQGKGVFRAFKRAAAQFPETEKLWFAFKKREMRRRVADWYNALCEDWNMEKVGVEPEEDEGLFFDFVFRPYAESDVSAARALLDKRGGNERQYAGDQMGEPMFVAETAAHDMAGFIAVKRKTVVCAGHSETHLYICNVEVAPEYRGLGIGSELCGRLLKWCADTGVSKVFIDLPAESEGFSRFLYRSAFKPVITRYCLDMGGVE